MTQGTKTGNVSISRHAALFVIIQVVDFHITTGVSWIPFLLFVDAVTQLKSAGKCPKYDNTNKALMIYTFH